MKKEDLIKKINELVPDGAEVVIFDHRKNLFDDCGDGSSSGIYKEFEIAHFTEEEIADGCVPFAVLSFDNDDYEEDGRASNENIEIIRKKSEEWDNLHKEIARFYMEGVDDQMALLGIGEKAAAAFGYL